MAKKQEKGSIISADAAAQYKVSDVKTPSGRKSVDNDDATARKLRGKSLNEVRDIAVEAGLGPRWNGTGEFKDKRAWKDLNPGQARMAVGNALRAIERGGKPKTKKAPKAKKAKKVKKAA